MKARPILFSGSMINAILEGRKTQTRRVLKPQPEDTEEIKKWGCVDIKFPYGKVGDLLWVRETFKVGAWRESEGCIALDYKANPELKQTPWIYIEDNDEFEAIWMKVCDELEEKGIKVDKHGQYNWEHGQSPLKWKPSIFMPKWASRITLKITDIRVERLQDISEDDCIKEGIDIAAQLNGINVYHVPEVAGLINLNGIASSKSAKHCFGMLWNSINKNWDDNPWVWVLDFEVINENFQQLMEAA